jgi:tRNA-dihydrouridine synthase
MPIVDLARRLEDAGVAAITIHCRTAAMGHSGAADWSWARRAREVVGIPVIVNGDVKSAADAKRAIVETGCEGVMVGRRAIEHPWIFREAHALLDEGVERALPTNEERIALCREHLIANVAARGEPYGVRCTRRHLSGYLHGLPGAASMRQKLNLCDSLEGCLAILDSSTEAHRAA